MLPVEKDAREAAILRIMKTLKPCPFCDGEAIIYIPRHRQGVVGYIVPHIYCNDCGVKMVAGHEHESVIEKWNKRTPRISSAGAARPIEFSVDW